MKKELNDIKDQCARELELELAEMGVSAPPAEGGMEGQGEGEGVGVEDGGVTTEDALPAEPPMPPQ